MSFWIQHPKLQYTEEDHRYTWLGTRKRSATEVLSSVAVRHGDNWKPVGFDSRWLSGDETASAFGTAFHKIASIILRGGIPQFPEAMAPWVEQFQKFIREWQIKPLCDANGTPIVEYPFYSKRYDTAGTPDCLASFGNKGVLGLFDWKSSTTASKSWRAQTAFYGAAAKEVFGIRQKIIHIPVRFDQKGFYPDIRDNCPEDLTWFLSLNNVLRMAA